MIHRGFRILFFPSHFFFHFCPIFLPLCYLKFKHSNIMIKKFFFLDSIPVQNHGIFLFFTYCGPCLSFRVLGFDFEVCKGSTFLFTFYFAFSGFLKCHSLVKLKKQTTKKVSTVNSFLVILSLNWINFNSVTLCFMLSVWLGDYFWFMDDNMGIFFCWIDSNVSYILTFRPSWFSWLARVHFEVTSSKWWVESKLLESLHFCNCLYFDLTV